jgi:hypothetical protein
VIDHPNGQPQDSLLDPLEHIEIDRMVGHAAMMAHIMRVVPPSTTNTWPVA